MKLEQRKSVLKLACLGFKSGENQRLESQAEARKSKHVKLRIIFGPNITDGPNAQRNAIRVIERTDVTLLKIGYMAKLPHGFKSKHRILYVRGVSDALAKLDALLDAKQNSEH